MFKPTWIKMKKTTQYNIAIISFAVGMAIFDLLFNSNFYKELNLSNAFVTVLVGYLVVSIFTNNEEEDFSAGEENESFLSLIFGLISDFLKINLLHLKKLHQGVG